LNDRIFTTLRRYTFYKWNYYHKNIGKFFDIKIKDKRHSNAKLIFMAKVKLSELSQDFLLYDTEGKYILPKGYLIMLIFEHIKPSILIPTIWLK
jgi:hypothetical protein